MKTRLEDYSFTSWVLLPYLQLEEEKWKLVSEFKNSLKMCPSL